MPNGRPPEDDPTLLLLLLGGAAVGLGIFALVGRRAGAGLAGPCPPLGDVDGDGSITHTDSQLVLEHEASLRQLSPAQLARADVNGDGVVNSIDAQLILQVAEGVPGAEAGFACNPN